MKKRVWFYYNVKAKLKAMSIQYIVLFFSTKFFIDGNTLTIKNATCFNKIF